MQMGHVPELTFEQRTEAQLNRIEQRFSLGEQMMALLEQDNSIALHALRELSKTLHAKTVESELGEYIEARGATLKEIRKTIRALRDELTELSDEKTDPGCG